MTLHEICRKKRRDIDMTQATLSEFSGVDQRAISQFERGKGGVSTKKLNEIFRVLDIDLSKLL